MQEKNKWILLLAVACFCMQALSVMAQEKAPVPPGKHKFALYIGAGPNLFFNNLVVGKEFVKEFNYSFTGRFMWEPEHHLSLGIESGYYCLYRVEDENYPDARIDNYAIPIMLVVNMKFLKTFYFNFASGQSILKNKVSHPLGDVNASTLSLGDFSGSLGYKRQWKDWITLGVETKFYYSSKLNDKNVALLFLAGFQL